MKQIFRVAVLASIAVAITAFSCVDFEVERPTYEIGEAGVLIVNNPSKLPMAIGGCNPTVYQERLHGRWVPDPFLRPACVFSSDLDGNHTLVEYDLIQPRSSIRIEFPTSWLQSTPGVMRILERVSTVCNFPNELDEPIECRKFETVTTDPVLIFEPGTTETVGRS